MCRCCRCKMEVTKESCRTSSSQRLLKCSGCKWHTRKVCTSGESICPFGTNHKVYAMRTRTQLSAMVLRMRAPLVSDPLPISPQMNSSWMTLRRGTNGWTHSPDPIRDQPRDTCLEAYLEIAIRSDCAIVCAHRCRKSTSALFSPQTAI